MDRECDCGCKRPVVDATYAINIEIRSARLAVAHSFMFASVECRDDWWASSSRTSQVPPFARSLHSSDRAIAVFRRHAQGDQYVDVEGFAFENTANLLAWWRGDPNAITARCVRKDNTFAFLDSPPEHWVIGSKP